MKTVEVLVVGEGREFWYAGCCVSPDTPDENNVSLKHLLSYRARHHDFSSHCNNIVIKLPSKVLHKIYIDFYANFMQDF